MGAVDSPGDIGGADGWKQTDLGEVVPVEGDVQRADRDLSPAGFEKAADRGGDEVAAAADSYQDEGSAITNILMKLGGEIGQQRIGCGLVDDIVCQCCPGLPTIGTAAADWVGLGRASSIGRYPGTING